MQVGRFLHLLGAAGGQGLAVRISGSRLQAGCGQGSPIRESIITADHRRQRFFDLRELWGYRDLLLMLARRDVAVRYRQTALGLLWAILQPLGMMLIFYVIFGRLARLSSDGIPYPLFALAALIPWQFFSSAMNSASNSVVNNPTLITKVYFPRLIIPLAALGAPAVDLMIATSLMAVLFTAYGYAPSVSVLALPALYLLAATIALGVGSFVAALCVSYRDFRHMMPFLTMSWMWLTPVAYPPSLFPEQWRPLLFLNPMTGVVDAIRAAWFGRPLDWNLLSVSVIVAVLLLCGGVAYFRAVERRFADIV